MRQKLFLATLPVWVSTGLVLLALGEPRAQAADLKEMKFEAHLIWATNDPQSPDPKHKPVEPEILKKVQELPLKWAHFFEVKRIAFQMRSGGTNTVALSEKCRLEVRSLGKSRFEVAHFGKDKLAWQGKPVLPKGETLVLGGNAPNATSWLVVLRRLE